MTHFPFTAQEFLTHEGYFVPDSNGYPKGSSVGRGDVARFMLSLLSSNAWVKKGVAMTTKWKMTRVPHFTGPIKFFLIDVCLFFLPFLLFLLCAIVSNNTTINTSFKLHVIISSISELPVNYLYMGVLNTVEQNWAAKCGFQRWRNCSKIPLLIVSVVQFFGNVV